MADPGFTPRPITNPKLIELMKKEGLFSLDKRKFMAISSLNLNYKSMILTDFRII